MATPFFTILISFYICFFYVKAGLCFFAKLFSYCMYGYALFLLVKNFSSKNEKIYIIYMRKKYNVQGICPVPEKNH
jgi:hypothetical protein